MTRYLTIQSVLFVCLGNICRSPLAEGALRTLVADRGLDLLVDSAGTGDWHIGSPPDARAIQIAADHGTDISGLRARQVAPADMDRFDLILAMDSSNLDDLGSLAREDARAEVCLALDLVPGRAGGSVADPYYGDAADFAIAWSEAMMIAEAIVDRIAGDS